MTTPDATTSPVVFTGGCLCGAVRYAAEGASREVANCHCSMCRRHSGAAFLTYAAYPRERVRFTRGKPAGFRSSAAAVRGHCAVCGSPLTYVGDADPDTIWLTVGSFDEPNRVSPTQDWYVATRLDWVPLDEALPKYAGAPGED